MSNLDRECKPYQPNQLGVDSWVPLSQSKPVSGKIVNAVFEPLHGKRKVIRAHYVKRWSIESLGDESYDEYSEKDDCYYLCEGWYENVENWPDFESFYVCEGKVTHWRLLPALPDEASQSDNEE